MALGACSMWPFGRKPPPAPPPVAMPPPPPPPPPPPEPVPTSGTISAAADLNPSVSNRPSPLIVRLYELRSDAAFNKADFIALYQGDQATLGGDLVAKDEMMIQPGESRPYQRKLAVETRYVAVFAAYRDIERAVWRAIAPVPAGKSLSLAVRAERQALSLRLRP